MMSTPLDYEQIKKERAFLLKAIALPKHEGRVPFEWKVLETQPVSPEYFQDDSKQYAIYEDPATGKKYTATYD